MRGLDNEERAALLAPPAGIASKSVIDRLLARGLVAQTLTHPDGRRRVATTPLGWSALRLDAAARQLEGVEA